jgi:competence protein ComEC
MRAAWIVVVSCGGILLRRPVVYANTFALAWLGVALANPADVFSAGCQLSFLAVAVLVFGLGRWVETLNDEPHSSPVPPPVRFSGSLVRLLHWTFVGLDPLERAVDEVRPWYESAGRWLVRSIFAAYFVNAVVWLAVMPLLARYSHLVSPIALLIGPPLVLLTSIALLSGFGLLLLAWCPPLAAPFAWVTQWCLAGCDELVALGLRVPGGYCFVTDVPAWWLVLFYAGLLAGLTLPVLWKDGRWAVLLVGWLALGVAMAFWPHRPGEFRCTFVAVGHGGCTVIETTHGHVALYDAGATQGPGVSRNQIAPFLWSRGIRRIDELIVSHADLDHFNGVKELTDMFAVGRLVCTPTFAERPLAAMEQTLAALKARGIPSQIVRAGQSWQFDGVSFDVLHPPVVGPPGKENVRSLVLLVRYEDASVLLTGDLEEAGLEQVLALPAPRIDVMQAPHHGSDKANSPVIANWARPRFVVSCQKEPLNERQSVRMYEKLGIPFLGTWPHGTVTVRVERGRAWLQTYHTGLVLGK